MSKPYATLSMAVLLVGLGLVCGHVGVEKRFQLIGFTSATVSGDIGVFGMTETCQAEFPGSRFCELTEVWRTVVIPQGLAGVAWVDSDRFNPSVTANTCQGWSLEWDVGLTVGADGKLPPGGGVADCRELHPVACCALVPVP